MRAKIRDTELYFDIDGAGLVVAGDRLRERPTAFLVHGGPGADHTSYKAGLADLRDRLQLVYFDHRGQGRSARGKPETYTLDNNVADLDALRDYLGLEKIVIIGASYGGMVGMAYAIRYPDRVSHLIVMATAPDHRFLNQAKQFIAAHGTAEQKQYAEILWQGNFKDEGELKDYFRVMMPLYSRTYDPANGWHGLDGTIYSVDAINQAFGGFLRTYSVVDELHKITAPTLVIGARHDWICAPEFSVEIAAKIPNADLRIFEQSGHLIRIDEPDALKDAIRGFLVYQT